MNRELPAENSARYLVENVRNGGYCIGCGACASVEQTPFEMYVNAFGCISARIKQGANIDDPSVDLRRICPFSGTSLNETEISRSHFDAMDYSDGIGHHLSLYAGYVVEGDFRSQGSSGGMATWLATELLSTNIVDGIVHVHQRSPDGEDRRLFEYGISTSVEAVKRHTKSQYYPIEMSEVVRQIRAREGRYAFIGLPCFVKAMRLLMENDPVVADRVVYCISLVCGHLKSMRWTDLLGWHIGIAPLSISRIGFREKIEGKPASEYFFRLTGEVQGKTESKLVRVSSKLGGSWEQGYFMYEACDYCDDIVGETADLSVGDAWLPEYSHDSGGTNLLIVRNRELQAILKRAKTEGRIMLDGLTETQALNSQLGGIRHRREGLAYRLWLKEKAHAWYPKKRIEPQGDGLSLKRKAIYYLRLLIARRSHREFLRATAWNSLLLFKLKMHPLTSMYKYIKKV